MRSRCTFELERTTVRTVRWQDRPGPRMLRQGNYGGRPESPARQIPSTLSHRSGTARGGVTLAHWRACGLELSTGMGLDRTVRRRLLGHRCGSEALPLQRVPPQWRRVCGSATAGTRNDETSLGASLRYRLAAGKPVPLLSELALANRGYRAPRACATAVATSARVPVGCMRLLWRGSAVGHLFPVTDTLCRPRLVP